MTTQAKIPTYRFLGSSGLRVYPLSLGTMGFGSGTGFYGAGGLTSTIEESEKILLKYISVGGNFIDTANFYQNEEWIGKIIKKNNIDRERLVIATKYSLPMVSGDPNAAGNNKKNLFRALRDSLARLQMDYIDILYVHFWDWSVDIKDLMRDLNEVVLSGKVLHIAASDIPAWVVASGNTIAEQHGWAKFVCYQGKYNLTERDMEFEIFPMCKANKIATVPWGALGQGKLTGVKTRENPTNGTRARVVMTENDFKIQDAVLEVAKEIGKTPSQVALAWAIQKSTSPLLGSRTYEQLEDSLQAIEIVLTTEQFNKLEEASNPKPIFPYTMLGKDTKSTNALFMPNPTQRLYDFDTKQ